MTWILGPLLNLNGRAILAVDQVHLQNNLQATLTECKVDVPEYRRTIRKDEHRVEHLELELLMRVECKNKPPFFI